MSTAEGALFVCFAGSLKDLPADALMPSLWSGAALGRGLERLGIVHIGLGIAGLGGHARKPSRPG